MPCMQTFHTIKFLVHTNNFKETWYRDVSTSPYFTNIVLHYLSITLCISKLLSENPHIYTPSPKKILSLIFISEIIRKISKWMVSLACSWATSTIWISWPFKIGPICCPKMSVRNYYSMLHNITEECRSHIMIWWCRPRFDSAWSGSERCRFVMSLQCFICEFKTTSNVLVPNLR